MMQRKVRMRCAYAAGGPQRRARVARKRKQTNIRHNAAILMREDDAFAHVSMRRHAIPIADYRPPDTVRATRRTYYRSYHAHELSPPEPGHDIIVVSRTFCRLRLYPPAMPPHVISIRWLRIKHRPLTPFPLSIHNVTTTHRFPDVHTLENHTALIPRPYHEQQPCPEQRGRSSSRSTQKGSTQRKAAPACATSAPRKRRTPSPAGVQ